MAGVPLRLGAVASANAALLAAYERGELPFIAVIVGDACRGMAALVEEARLPPWLKCYLEYLARVSGCRVEK